MRIRDNPRVPWALRSALRDLCNPWTWARQQAKLRIPPTAGQVLVAPTGVQLQARAAKPIIATYTVRRSGLRRRILVVEVTADGPLPSLVVRVKPNGVPASARDGTELGRLDGGAPTARLEVQVGGLTLPAGVRVFATGTVTGRPFTLTDPPDGALLVST